MKIPSVLHHLWLLRPAPGLMDSQVNESAHVRWCLRDLPLSRRLLSASSCHDWSKFILSHLSLPRPPFFIRRVGGGIRTSLLSNSGPYADLSDNAGTVSRGEPDKAVQMDLRADWWSRLCHLFGIRLVLHTDVRYAIFLLAHLSCSCQNDACH